MPISSVSRIYDAVDPVMENDLELMAKVDGYLQTRFDTGAAALQNEVNNWAMMTNIAKPELKQYANQKLNNLVSGINNLGGVNIGDINNVNALKSLGYNIYGDARIVDGIATTQRMKTLASNSQAKLSGKDAKNYDPSVADYLMKGYTDWANDGDVNNAKYDGPVDLPMGSMNTINEKVQKYLKELKPDSDSTPQGDLQKSYGYFQVDGKWLKGSRIQEAIDAVIDENDALVFRSHGWKALNSDDDKSLISKLGLVYDNSANSIRDNINAIELEIKQAVNDAGRKLELEKLKKEQLQALKINESEKATWYNKNQLTSQEREGIQESLYKNAWRSNIVNSYSYSQEKKELKSNMPLIFHDRIANQAQQWAADYNLDVAQYQLAVRKQDFEESKSSLNDPFTNNNNLPLTQEPNTGKNNEQKNPAGFMDDINSTYFKENAVYYQYLYNTMGANDTAGRFEQVNGSWKPKEQYKGQIDKEVEAITSKIDNYSNLTDKERQSLNIPFSKEELRDIFTQRAKINTYKAYSKLANDKETEIINAAIAKNQIPGDWRNIILDIPGYGKKTVQEALALKNAGVIPGDLKGIQVNDPSGKIFIYNEKLSSKTATPSQLKFLKEFGFNVNDYSLKQIEARVNKLRNLSKKTYQDGGGKLFNSFSVPIPFGNLSKIDQEVIKKQLQSKVQTSNFDTIEPIKGYIQMNFETGKPEYFITVQSGEGKKRKTETISVTEPNGGVTSSGIGKFFPQSDIGLIWGLSLSKNGSTPFSKQDNYKDALRTAGSNYPYQISTISNNLNGTVGLRVKIALPTGNGNMVETNVRNLHDGSYVFPSSIEAVQKYLDDWLSTPELKARFYKEHNIPLN